jgi:glycosyltransferase involved in cell wall biosynthesis
MILHVIARLNLGGTSVWIKNLINGFELRGIQSFVITGRTDSELEDLLVTDPRVIKFEKWGRKSSILENLKAIVQIRKLIKSIKPKVVNTHTSKAGIIGRLAALSIFSDRPKIIHTIHGHYLYGYSRPLISKAWLLNEAVMSLFSDKVICVGSQVRDDLIKSHLFQKSKLVVILPGIEDKNADQSALKSLASSHIKRNLTVGWMGRLEKVKNPSQFVSIAKMLPSTNFIMVGAGKLSNELLVDLPNNLMVSEFMEPSDLWKNCDVAVSTSLNEGVPTALIEANFYGRPIIAPNVGSIRDVVYSGVNGILLENTSIEDFCEAINALNEKRETYRALQRGCALISDKFELVNMIKLHSAVYDISWADNR